MTSRMSIVITIRWVSPFVYPIHILIRQRGSSEILDVCPKVASVLHAVKENKAKKNNSDIARVQSEKEVKEQSTDSSSDALPMTTSILISRIPREDPDQRWTLETVGPILHRGTCVHRTVSHGYQKAYKCVTSPLKFYPSLKKRNI